MRGDKNQDVHLCPECKLQLDAAFVEETKDPKTVPALVLGIAAAALGSFGWYLITIATGMEIGYISIGLGYLVGTGVYLGSGKKRGLRLQVMSALLAVFAILVAEKFILEHYVNEYIRNNPGEFPDMAAGEYLSVSFFEPMFWENLVSPISVLIYAIGVYVAFKVCAPRKI